MNNDIKDKQFLALELTKIAYPSNAETLDIDDETIYKSYEYYLSQLTGLIDSVNTVSSLKNEVVRLQNENAALKRNNLEMLEPLIADITSVVNNCRGDMEQYVYDAILSTCRRYEK